MKILLMATTGIIVLFSVSATGFEPVDYSRYIKYKQIENLPIYQGYLRLGMYPMRLPLNEFVRQPYLTFPGDYFWPPHTRFKMASDIVTQLRVSENGTILEFISGTASRVIPNSLILGSLRGFAYDFRSGSRREAYTMLSEGDTVYVVSGWLGKFLSFYRVVPGDFRLSSSEFMKELGEITPLAGEIKESGFRHESDSLNYLWEYVDKDKMFRVRNYLMRTVLPPSPPDSPEQYYNLIEVTRFYDKEAIP